MSSTVAQLTGAINERIRWIENLVLLYDYLPDSKISVVNIVNDNLDGSNISYKYVTESNKSSRQSRNKWMWPQSTEWIITYGSYWFRDV